MKISNREEFEMVNVFGMGAPNDAYAQYFTGQSCLNPLTQPGASAVSLADVYKRQGTDRGTRRFSFCTVSFAVVILHSFSR